MGERRKRGGRIGPVEGREMGRRWKWEKVKGGRMKFQ
jgi:hypothetical protein